MKTKKEFLENYASNPKLTKKVLKAGGLTWNEIKEMGWDCFNAASGSVPGMIYHSDTVKFAKNNFLEINEQLQNFENYCGPLDKPKFSEGETNYYNWFAWFAWENTISEILSYLENN